MKNSHSVLRYGHLDGCALNFINYSGKTLRERYGAFSAWLDNRRAHQVLPFAKAWKPKSLTERIDGQCSILNFGAHDYLGLSFHPDILETAREAVTRYGIHSASSQTLTGRTELSDQLENRIAQLFGTDTAMLFSTGWMAGFGVLSGLCNARDTIVMDKLAHNCLQTGAACASQKLVKFNHNDLEHLENILRECRANDAENGLFVVTETLYSMNADAPDLPGLLRLIDRYEAILIIDVAHDFGVNGAQGLGLFERVSLRGRDNVVVMGSFSKTFGANGGFIAGPQVIRDQIMFASAPYVFSTGISVLQCAVVLKAFDLVFSAAGVAMRRRLRQLERYAINALQQNGFQTDGDPHAIIPVVIGAEKTARLIARELEERQLVVNLVEFPAVPRGRAILRFLLNATHTETDIDRAVEILCAARASVGMEDQVPALVALPA